MEKPVRLPSEWRPCREVRLGSKDIVVERRADGVLYLRAAQALPAYPEKLTERLLHWAELAPERIFLAQRSDSGAWRSISYARTLAVVRRLGEALLRRNLSPERPIAILSGNDIEHALLGLAANYVGIPYAPISPAYSLAATDYGKLRQVIDLLTPGLVFAADGSTFTCAIDAVVGPDVEVVVTRNPLANRPSTPFSNLLAATATSAADAAHASVGPDAIAKFLFTSGTTGLPKGVINTQRMWCSNQVMIRTAFAYLADEPPVLVDWAPWNHTGGGNHDFGLALFNGGSFYIDEGKPVPGAIEITVRNLRQIAPTWYFNVPKGYEALLPHLRADKALCESFFKRVKVLFYAGAGLAQYVHDEIIELAFATCGERVVFLTSLGATETGPMSVVRTWDSSEADNVGLPAAGLELKLVPRDGKLEARVRGPNVTPGYWRQPALTRQAFDEEGFYRLGDALELVDADDPRQGLRFDGRIAEDFKLATATWVSVGPLRTKLIEHFAPFARDAVIAGADRDQIGALVFADLDACRALCPDIPVDAPPDAVLDDARIRGKFRALLHSVARPGTGSSNRVCRVILLGNSLSLDAGEITDKGTINQRAVLQRHAALVDELYATPRSPRVIAIDEIAQ